jgi:very-short-patch-repair endonuclease
VEYQLEESELGSEPLPAMADRRLLLLYEAAEGGAGVLRRLLDDNDALRRVARQALQICHFDPDTGEDRRRADGAREDCEAACYDCLMSYTNQPDHRLLDRKLIRDLLLQLATAEVDASPVAASRGDHLAQLLRQCASDLERGWLRFLDERDLRLPSHAQRFVEACKTRPDFLYVECQTAIYVDGPHHDYPERRERDVDQTERMEDTGYSVIRFGANDDWDAIIRRTPSVFGTLRDQPSRS